MKNIKIKFFPWTMGMVIALGILCFAQQPSESPRWYKGNTHTHTLNSDGDSSPEDVVRWYRENGYHFIVITDHNFLTNVEGLNALYGVEERFLVLKGVEVSDRYGPKSIHVNCLNPKELVLPQKGSSVAETIQNNVDAIRDVSGIPHINHPNYRWSITADDLKQIQDCSLFELFSGHPRINNFGGGGLPSVEEIWDEVLTSGKLFYGVAVDDSHIFKEPWNHEAARPGQGWIMVRSERLTSNAIIDAIERGDFYASTGVEIKELKQTKAGMSLAMEERGMTKFHTLFIGKKGHVLKEDFSNPAIYDFKGDEMYIRAKVMDSNGRIAWTQPVLVAPERK